MKIVHRIWQVQVVRILFERWMNYFSKNQLHLRVEIQLRHSRMSDLLAIRSFLIYMLLTYSYFLPLYHYDCPTPDIF